MCAIFSLICISFHYRLSNKDFDRYERPHLKSMQPFRRSPSRLNRQESRTSQGSARRHDLPEIASPKVPSTPSSETGSQKKNFNFEDDDDNFNFSTALKAADVKQARQWDRLASNIKHRATIHRPKVYHPSETQEQVDDASATADLATLVRSVPKKVQPVDPDKELLTLLLATPPATISDMAEFRKPEFQTNFCFKCWQLVSAEPVGLVCLYCPVIAHRHCVRELQAAAARTLEIVKQQKALEKQSKKSRSFMQSFDSFEDAIAESSPNASFPPTPAEEMPGKFEPPTEEELNMNWVCPFCVESLHKQNEFVAQMSSIVQDRIDVKKGSIALQSVIRMKLQHKKWLEKVRSAIKIQRFMRARAMQVEMREEQRTQRTTVRLALHKLVLQLSVGDMFPLAKDSVGETQIIGKFGSVMLGKFLKGPPRDKAAALKRSLDLLKPSFTSPITYLMPSEKNGGSGSLFLTLTVHDSDEKQTYRIDVQLCELRQQPLADENDSDSAGDGDGSLPSLPSLRDKKMKYYRPLQRGVVMLPAVQPDSIVRLNVSEVTKWPNSVCIGRCELNIFDYIITKQVVSMNQQFREVHRGDETIAAANFCKLNIANQKGIRAAKSRFELGSGSVTWSLVALNAMTGISGPLLILPDATAFGAKKKMWGVILDKMLYLYANSSDILIKEVVDLQNCRIALHKDDVRSASKFESTTKS
jgi:hypothetical protein